VKSSSDEREEVTHVFEPSTEELAPPHRTRTVQFLCWNAERLMHCAWICLICGGVMAVLWLIAATIMGDSHQSDCVQPCNGWFVSV
jgi:hypothetical protein